MKAINSLKELVETLPHCSGKEYVEIAHHMQIPLEDFEPYAHWSKETYTRNCISRSKDYELLLLCWEEGMDTPIHCHGGEECWVYALQGTIKEERFDFTNEKEEEIELVQKTTMQEDSISYMNDNMGFHKLINVGEGRAMTLHLYMNPIDRCRIFDEEQAKFEIKELEYHTYKGEPVNGEIALETM